MIDMIVKIPQSRPPPLYQDKDVGVLRMQKGNYAITCGSRHPYEVNPDGRHPFNIITMEILDD